MIKIKKRVEPGREAAPLVANAPSAQVAAPPDVPRAADVALKDWKTNHPPIGAKQSQCSFCKQWYIVPCDETKHLNCLNWVHAQKKLVKA